MGTKAFIALGSNLGDRLNFLRGSVDLIDNDINCRVIEESSVYESKPFGIENQENFLNAVIEIITDYSVIELFNKLKKIEKTLGRHSSVRWGPREIDLDLLFFNQLIYSDENLNIPHRGIIERDFVLVPLKEIAPDFVHPELKLRIGDLKIPCNAQTIIRKINESLREEKIKLE
jgi:2-amino-4-hydroxy-6-hydroxymethyldihydropteridine diphosphokinase